MTKEFKIYPWLGYCCLTVLLSVVLVETYIPNAKRITTTSPVEYLDFVPRYFEWTWPQASTWATFAFSYQVLMVLLALTSSALIAWELTNRSAITMLKRLLESEGGNGNVSADRHKLRLAQKRREALIEPALGGLFISLVVWLLAVIIGGKVDPEWSRLFLVPPLLVASNLQEFGHDLAIALLRSSWHLLQGTAFGAGIGLVLGFFLSHMPWFQKWTTWHLTVIAALPPVLMLEVFKQAARFPHFPVVSGDEIAFKTAVILATWAVLWPVLTATSHALSHIDREYRYSIRLLGARTPLDRLRFVDLPAVLPAVLANLRVGVVIGLILLLLGESQGSPGEMPSLGLFFSEFTQNYKLQTLVALVVFTSILVIAFEIGIRLLEIRLVVGRPRYKIAAEDDSRASAADEQRNALELFEELRSKKWKEPLWPAGVWHDGGEVIEAENISKSYGDMVAFRLEGRLVMQHGELVSIIGRSGAGKSTLLKLMLGIEAPDERRGSKLIIAGRNLIDERGRARENTRLDEIIGYVAQRPQLIPNRTVEQNILFGLRQQWSHIHKGRFELDQQSIDRYQDYALWLCGEVEPRNWVPATRRGQDEEADASPLDLLIRFFGLEDRLYNYPSELSGGEAQRVHLLRWLLLGRPLLFTDEAFSALDQPLKAMVRDAIQRHAKSLGQTLVNVSHDRADVLQISDRILFIDGHEIAGDGDPRTVYYSPHKRDLAVFLGHTNIFSAYMGDDGGRIVNLERDAYRDVVFDTVIPMNFRVPIEMAQQARLENGNRDLTTGKRITLFVPRSDVNISGLAQALDYNLVDTFYIESYRFTGTHYELRLARNPASGRSRLRLDSIMEDDVLEDMLKAKGLLIEDLSGLVAEIELRRGIAIGESGA